MENKERSNNIKQIILAILSIILIGFLFYSNYVKPIDKIYSPNSYYSGKTVVDSGENPLEVYNKMIGRKNNGNSDEPCDPKFTLIEEDKMLLLSNRLTLPILKDDATGYNSADIKSWGESYGGETLGLSGNNNHWYLWYNTSDSSKMQIVSPYSSFVFRTSNFGGLDIGVGPNSTDSYLLIKNVKNWYCHANAKAGFSSHTIHIGTGATDDNYKGWQSVDGSHAMIGVASKDTYVVGIKIENGLEEECSPDEILEPN